MSQATADPSERRARGPAKPATLQDLRQLVGRVHPDVILKLLNAMPDLDLTVRQGTHTLGIRNFNRQMSLARGPATYCQDGLATVVDCSFMRDAQFLAAYRAGKADFLSLLDSERALLHFRLMYERAVADYAQRLAELEMQVGRDLPRAPAQPEAGQN